MSGAAVRCVSVETLAAWRAAGVAIAAALEIEPGRYLVVTPPGVRGGDLPTAAKVPA